MPYITKRRISPKRDKVQDAKAHNEKWAHYYQDRRWKKLRDWFKLHHPLCEDCLINGRSVPADEVHHIRPFSSGATEDEKIALLLDPTNLICLCRTCHLKRHGYLKNRS